MRHTAALHRTPAAELPVDVRLLNASASALFVLAAAIFMALLMLWLSRQPVFAIRAIRVEGDLARNSVSTIRANALPQLAGNFFTFDLGRGQRAFESVPWVRHAIVRRVWPNRIAVSLQEHRAAALWSQDDGDKLVKTEGEVFEANLGDVEDDRLPTLAGPDGSSGQVLAMYRRLAPLFARQELEMDALSLSGRGSWRAEFDSGAEVELGRGTDQEMQARVERFLGTLPQVIARYQRPLVYADLRHNEGYAVRLKGITTTLEAAAPGRRK
jgi:cell division protein FtsQ